MLKPNTTLIGARERDSNFPLPVYDNGDGQLYVFGLEFGASMIIRARCWEDAWEIAIDESPTIPEHDLPEAYGFYGPNASLDLQQAIERADAGLEEYPELEEGYEYQSNATGTGIVDIGYYTWMREWDERDNQYYRLIIRSHNCPVVNAVFSVGNGGLTYSIDGAVHTCASKDVGDVLRDLDATYVAVHATVSWGDGDTP